MCYFVVVCANFQMPCTQFIVAYGDNHLLPDGAMQLVNEQHANVVQHCAEIVAINISIFRKISESSKLEFHDYAKQFYLRGIIKRLS